MFEYLMPLLVMPTYENTLLDQTYGPRSSGRSSTARKRGVPWGMSECGYNAVDAQLNYQYRAFGVPGLGLKRGLGRGPGGRAVCLRAGPDGGARGGVRNLQRLAAAGLRGQIRLVRSHRLHAVAPAARASQAPSCARSWRITRA